jgi:hypothetical protein
MIDLFAWLPVIILAGAYLLVSQVMNMLMIQEQVMGFVWLIGILAFLVLVLLTVWYLKDRQNKGGDDGKNGCE